MTRFFEPPLEPFQWPTREEMCMIASRRTMDFIASSAFRQGAPRTGECRAIAVSYKFLIAARTL